MIFDTMDELATRVAAVIDANIKNEGSLDDKCITAESVGIKRLLREWASNKAALLHSPLFNGELIRNLGEVNITPNADDDENKYYLSDFCCKLHDYRLEGKICWYEFDALTEFLEAQSDGFLTNQVTNDYSIYDIFLNKGRKISRCIKYFIKDEEKVREIQDLYSTYIQKRKIRGELCISIHPLDFLSSSENTYKWRSCHALDGEYKGGNLSYMIDPTTIVCYIKGQDGVKLPRFPESVPWNDKKWRMLIHIDPKDAGFVAFGRPYPFASDDLRNLIYEKFKRIYSDINFSPLEQIEYNEYEYPAYDFITGEYKIQKSSAKSINFHGQHIPRVRVVDDSEGTCFYDLLESSFYDFWYFYNEEKNEVPFLRIGLSPCCVYCGASCPTSEYFLCGDCLEYEYQEEEEELPF